MGGTLASKVSVWGVKIAVRQLALSPSFPTGEEIGCGLRGGLALGFCAPPSSSSSRIELTSLESIFMIRAVIIAGPLVTGSTSRPGTASTASSPSESSFELPSSGG